MAPVYLHGCRYTHEYQTSVLSQRPYSSTVKLLLCDVSYFCNLFGRCEIFSSTGILSVGVFANLDLIKVVFPPAVIAHIFPSGNTNTSRSSKLQSLLIHI